VMALVTECTAHTVMALVTECTAHTVMALVTECTAHTVMALVTECTAHTVASFGFAFANSINKCVNLSIVGRNVSRMLLMIWRGEYRW